jgi:hypothetical protein
LLPQLLQPLLPLRMQHSKLLRSPTLLGWLLP